MPTLASLPISDTPVAILDFETTGLRPGADRVVEVAVVRLDPGSEPRVVLDTLVNPRRRMACTDIHGITDADVADAPEFAEIVPALLAALGGCAMAAYNVYFDLKFLEYELDRAGHDDTPPHFCLMYLRAMLGLGGRCSLDDACREHGIVQTASHIAAADVFAEASLYRFYQGVCRERGVETFADLAQLRDYKFCESFSREPLLFRAIDRPPRLKSRRNHEPTPPLSKGGQGRSDRDVMTHAAQECDAKFPPLSKAGAGGVAPQQTPSTAPLARTPTPLPGWRSPVATPGRPSSASPLSTRELTQPGSTDEPLSTIHHPLSSPPRQLALRQYWDALKLVLSDLDVSDGELDYIERKKQELGLTAEETRLQHARVFANIIAQFADDQRIDDRERRKLNRLHQALSRLGWAPGE